MFYSYEILTKRENGVATVWLLATLGAKSATRKISRKNIIAVDIQRACDVIIKPEAPLALRLQSNLLYGVSRVYDQQCGYVLHDAQLTQNLMRAMMKVVRHDELDPQAGKARPGQLVLLDDPAFLLDLALPPLEFDFNPDNGPSPSSHLSQLSPYAFDQRGRSSSHGSMPDIQLPSSSRNSYQLPFGDPFHPSSAVKTPGLGRVYEEEHLIFEDNFDDNLDFEFDEHGQLQDRATPVLPPLILGSDPAASGRVRRDHEDGQAFRVDVGQGDDFIPNHDDDAFVLPDAEAFPPRKRLASDESPDISTDIESAQAPLRKKPRKARVVKPMELDTAIRHDIQQLRDQQVNYLENMDEIIHEKQRKQEVRNAKKNMERIVWHGGIGGVGFGHGQRGIAGDLAVIFSGDNLRLAILGVLPQDRKRKSAAIAAEAGIDDDDETRHKRARTSEDDFQVGRFDDNEGMRPDFNDESEVGRRAGSALDEPRSSVMPWNVSASLHSHNTGSAARGRHSSILPGRISRLTSASPLIGRGRLDSIAGAGAEIPMDIERLDDDPGLEFLNFNSSDHGGAGFDDHSRDVGSLGIQAAVDNDFELYGAAAGVDTQTAGTSQWMRDAMAKESTNFYDYVRNTIREEGVDELEEAADYTAEPRTTVSFQKLIPEDASSSIVAAQAFLHVLTLATRGWLRVEQVLPYGVIEIGLTGTTE